MKKIFTIIVLAALSLTAMAQQKKVAVYVTGEQSGVSKVLGDQLVAAFSKSGRYTAVERTSSFLAELGNEQSYQRTGAVSDKEIASLGYQFGVEFVCVAELSEVFGEKYVSARLIDVETAEVVNASNASSPMNSMDELLKVTTSITKELTGKTAKEKLEEQAAQEAERKRKEEELKREYAQKEKKYMEQISQGYIEILDYYVTWPSDKRFMHCEEAGTFQRNCTNGGFHDWRIPSFTEVCAILKAIFDLSSEARLGAGPAGHKVEVYSSDFKIKINNIHDYAFGGVESRTLYGTWYAGFRYYGDCHIVFNSVTKAQIKDVDLNYRAACILVRNK